jgi:excisionase family DNA binding protein
MATQSTTPLRSIGQVADHLGVSTKTVRRWIHNGELAAFQVGRQWRISPDDLERFLWQRRRSGLGGGVQ